MAAVISVSCRNGFVLWLFILTLSLSLASCSSKTQPPSNTTAEIRIGFIITTSEDRIRTNVGNLVDMVRNRFEEEQGLKVGDKMHPVKIVIREIEGGIPEQAVRAVKELINQERVVAIVGPHYSIDAIPAGEVAERTRIPLISPTSIHPHTTGGRKYVFRTAFLAKFQARAMARFCVRELRAVNIAVLFNAADPYSRGLAEVFRRTVIQEGGRIGAFETYVTGQNDFTAQLEKIKGGKPESLYLPNLMEETESIVLQARDLGIEAVLLGSNSWDSPRFSEMGQFDGAYITAHMSPDALTGEAKVLSDVYLSRYGLELDDGAALTWDAIGLLLAAIQHAGSYEPDDIRSALYDMGPYEGVAGRIDYTDSGDPERDGVIIHFEDGRARFHKRVPPQREEESRGQRDM